MFENIKDLKCGDLVVVSVVPKAGAEIGTVANLSETFIGIKAQGVYQEYCRDTGFSPGGEEFGKILQEYEIAIKEAGMECPHCGAGQKNFFMACELLQGGKNCKCFYCEKLIWLSPDGNAMKVTSD